ncbi:MAG TPA: alpha/beta hydrolase [Bryobacteraceae bacterium]|nr:alpha/beta hydrolase [Bryobacteraceae bacterium]
MRRREFLQQTAALIPVSAFSSPVTAGQYEAIDSAWYQRERRFAELPVGRVAYVEAGRGPVALFVHGYPLNGYQWRGAIERLRAHRRCLAPDVLGMGYTQTPREQKISPETQAEMLSMLLDALHAETVDLVANDSGGLVAQLFLARYPRRVRTLLLTNCDVDENNPPPQFQPLIELAKKGTLVDRFIVPQLADKAVARSPKGMGGLAYTYPEQLSDEAIEMYFRPIVETPLKKAQMEQYAISMGSNVLVAIREDLRRWRGSARMVWGMKDTLFGVQWAEWLDRTFSGSLGVRRVEGANLFFPEEMPDLIAEEAIKLWSI